MEKIFQRYKLDFRSFIDLSRKRIQSQALYFKEFSRLGMCMSVCKCMNSGVWVYACMCECVCAYIYLYIYAAFKWLWENQYLHQSGKLLLELEWNRRFTFSF